MRHYRPALRIMFPYCFKLAKKSEITFMDDNTKMVHWKTVINQDSDGYVLVAFNRDYKYIPRGTLRFIRKPSTFKGIWNAIYEDSLYMYNDDPYSRTDYFKRLDKLLSHKHEVVKDKTVNIYSIENINYEEKQ